jgi:uncharacterized protein YdaL
MRARRRALGIALAGTLLAGVLAAPQALAAKKPPAPVPTSGTKTLVLYDTSGDWGHLGELYAMYVSNLANHFGTSTAVPVSRYTAGQMRAYNGVVYIGSTWGETLPEAFLDDVLADVTPIIWMDRNIWQLTDRSKEDFSQKFGWSWSWMHETAFSSVVYKGTALRRDGVNAGGVRGTTIVDPARVKVLAEAVKDADGTRVPWALRAGKMTYIAENPITYTNENDRIMIFSDLLFDLLAPTTPERHRALVRLEDVGPDADPQSLRQIADYLYAQRVPFSFGVYTVFEDPNGVDSDGQPVRLRLRDAPEVVSAIKYMISKGGTMLMHGYSHQFSAAPNPYNGKSGDDFEFYSAHVDADDYVRLDGPVPGDSTAWALSRVDKATAEFKACKLPVPSVFEFPHYAGSATDYRAIATRFTTRYERGLYFSGVLSGKPVDHSRLIGQFFPYVVKDVYGTKVLPENLGNVELEYQNHHPPRYAADIVHTAKLNLVVRDGFASFFYHPYLGVSHLKEIVPQIKALGYTFVSPTTL